jgi:hypothetical protein
MGVGGQRYAPAALAPQSRSGIHGIGGWVGPRTGLDGSGKSRPQPGFDARIRSYVLHIFTDLIN